MAALLAPVAGAVVGTSLLYGIHVVQTARRDAVLAQIEVRLQQQQAEEEAGRKKAPSADEVGFVPVPTRYRSATRPSVTEELRDRWNTHIFEAIDVVSRVQWDIAASKAYGQVRSLLPSSLSEAEEQAQRAKETVVDQANKAAAGMSLR
ncbi:unnamed protein product [Tilletia controversa]|uniref:Altered inheritance of mitochondria protein 5, mitochondrial n=3 Tax=Tilletia TaxID=13289 RepID=A0A8X7MKS4_9BASI|nr:hypothetical protein CF336_g7601 [Tilletia laevis]KAE8186332.1 hypothetical protein CF328_g7264 [Tilletia controversa]KAE8247234.1 hypothetical protein A4X03_0g7104 [Tilletia caries]KAE8187970.1 hypothetical protein CF335_g7017 [Tilletia laevis]KAE8239577.1 hypothetical protein A4X06_0g8192 [Tilletia controversa]